MQIFRGPHNPSAEPCALSIGNFDGVHLGHQALLRRLVDKARTLGLPASVLTFQPHPREFFSPDEAPSRLTSLREKLLLLAENGVDRLYVQPFNTTFANLSASDFIRQALVEGIRIRHLLIGDDFRFGARRDGDFAMLRAVGRTFGFEVEAMPTLALTGNRVSSSSVRQALEGGEIEHAAALLGRPYSITGRVTHGNKIGRTLGFPTLNLPFSNRNPPLSGVFVVQVEGLSPERLSGIANVGWLPTARSGHQARLEVNLLDWSGDAYGKFVRVHFLAKLRSEQRFASLTALTEQIQRDALSAREWFAGAACCTTGQR